MCPCLPVRSVQWGRFFAGIGKDFFGISNTEQSDISLASVQGGIGPQLHETCNKLKKEGASDKFESSTPIPVPKLNIRFW